MTRDEAVAWMVAKLRRDQCLYQDDVVDYLVRNRADDLLRENAEGSLVLGLPLLNGFKAATPDNVVWVRPDRYWRPRVAEDDPGREARG